MEPQEHSIREQAAQAEAFLFFEGGTLSKQKLASLLKVDSTRLNEITVALTQTFQGHGLCLIESEKEISLAASPETSQVIQTSYEQELSREIGDAGLEVLSILLYRGPSTRAQIDYIRGVNTSSTVRTLLSRGLIERASNPHDSREYLYRPTTELLAHLGVKNIEELPEYAKIANELAAFEDTGDSDAGNVFDNNHGDTARESDTA